MEKSKGYIKALLVTLTLGTGIFADARIVNNIEEDNRVEITNQYEEEQLNKIIPEQEENLSAIAKKTIAEISSQPNRSKYLESLDINIETLLFGYENMFNPVSTHEYTALYDEKTDSIYWDDVAEYIYKNSVNQAEIMTNVYAPSQQEIKNYVTLLKETYDKIKFDFKDYDTKQLACKLEYYAILKSTIQQNNMIATTSIDDITFFPIFNTRTLEEQEDTIKHEEIHMITRGCFDATSNGALYGISVTSVDIDNIYNDCIITERYNPDFINEIYATLYAAEMTTGKQQCYYTYDEGLDFLQGVLALNEDYQVDDFLQQMIYQDPISFIQSFPVYGQEEEQFFLDNLKALKGLDILIKPNQDWNDHLKTNYPELSYTKEAQTEIEKTVFNHFAKIFYNNLIVLNEHHPEMTIEDNAAFISVFSKLETNIVTDDTLLEQKKEDNPKDLIEDSFNNKMPLKYSNNFLTSYKDIFIKYLEKRYNKESEELKKEIDNAENIMINYQFPDFLEQEKQEFYQFLYEDNRDIYDSYPRTLVKQK